MASESFFKDLFRSSMFSFFRILAIAFALLIVIVVCSVLLQKPPAPAHTTTVVVIPNDSWKQAPFSKSAPTLVKINVHGVIGLDKLTQDNIRTQLIDTVDGEVKIDQVKGILLSINSPGGTADDSDAIYRFIQEYKKRFNVPVYAFVDGMAASGGMMIACAADKVFATESSIIGSVGVILGPVFNFSSLMDNLGIKSLTITAGKNKDELNPFRPWKPNEAATIQTLTDSFYQQFLKIVSANRPKLTKEVLVEQGAAIHSAERALELGYIDECVSSVDDVMKRMATTLKIEADYQVVEMQAKNWIEELFASEQACLPKIAPDTIEHTIKLPGNLHPSLAGKFLYLYCPEYGQYE